MWRDNRSVPIYLSQLTLMSIQLMLPEKLKHSLPCTRSPAMDGSKLGKALNIKPRRLIDGQKKTFISIYKNTIPLVGIDVIVLSIKRSHCC